MAEPSTPSEKPLFLLVLSSAHIDEEARKQLQVRQSQPEAMHRALLRRYGQRNDPKEGK